MSHTLSAPVKSPETLQDVLERLEQLEGLTASRRRDHRSAVRAVSRFAGCPPGAIPATIPKLRSISDNVQPGRFGMKARRLSNIRSLFVDALIITGVAIDPLRLEIALSPGWQAVRDALSTAGERNTIARFARWASGCCIVPSEVTDAIIADYADALENRSLVLKPRKHVQNLVRCWNRAVETADGWPQTRLTPLRSRETILLPEQTFPESFVTDLHAWTDRLAGADPLEDIPFKPLRSVSVESRRQTLLRCASILVHKGKDPEDIHALSCLVEPDNLKTILRYLLARNDGDPSWQTHGVASTLLPVARHWVQLQGDALRAIETLCAKVRVTSEGMTAKNRDTLRLFEDERFVHELLTLPEQMMQDALRAEDISQRSAYQASIALAISILLCAPVRIENLHSIEIDRHILRHGSGRCREVLLRFPAHEVKNDKTIELPLATDTVRLLDRYLRRVHPVLAAPGCRHLFPGRAGTKRTKIGLGMAIAKATEKHLGIRVTPHQFRHLTGYLFLRAYPGEFETVRALLGHKSLQTTVQFYAGMETAEAGRRFVETVLHPRRSARGNRR